MRNAAKILLWGPVLLASIGLGTTTTTTTAAVVTANDLEIAEDASVMRDEMCVGLLEASYDETKMYEKLKNKAEPNFVDEAFREGEDIVEATGIIQKIVIDTMTTPSTALGKAGGIVGFLLCIIFYVLCVWQSCCPCLLKIHQGPKDWGKMGKTILLAVIFCLCMLMLCAASMGFSRGPQVSNGVHRATCAGARMVDATLSGVNGDEELGGSYFLGFLPLLNNVTDIIEILRDPATEPTVAPDDPVVYVDQENFIVQARGIIGNTATLEKAMTALREFMALLTDKMIPVNMNPVISSDPNTCTLCGSGTETSQHRCTLCEAISEGLLESKASMDASMAGALTSIRDQSDVLLGPENLDTMRNQMKNDMLASVSGFKEMLMANVLEMLADGKGMKANMETYADYFNSATQGMSAYALFLCLCGAAAALMIGIRDVNKDENKPDDQNPYYKSNYRCDMFVWNCGCWFAIPCILIAGILQIVIWPLSAICVTLLDMDSAAVASYTFLNLSNQSQSMMTTCLFEEGDGDLLTAIKTMYNESNETSGEWEMIEIGMNEFMRRTVTDKVDAIFAPLSEGESAEECTDGDDDDDDDDDDAPPPCKAMTADLTASLRMLTRHGLPAFYFLPDEESFKTLVESGVGQEFFALDFDHDTRQLTCATGAGRDTVDVACQHLKLVAMSTSAVCGITDMVADKATNPLLEDMPATIYGMEHLIKHIEDYPRDVDGLATTISCPPNPATDIMPKCPRDDWGLCKAVCIDTLKTKAGYTYTVGKMPDPHEHANFKVCVNTCMTSYDASVIQTDQCAVCQKQPCTVSTAGCGITGFEVNGINDEEREKFCPANAAYRLLLLRHKMATNAPVFTIPEFDYDAVGNDGTLPLCSADDGIDPADGCPWWSANVDSCIATETEECLYPFSVPREPVLKTTETMATFAASLTAAADGIDNAETEMNVLTAQFKPQLELEMKVLLDENFVAPFDRLLEAKMMNCKYLYYAYNSWVEGMCYEIQGGVLVQTEMMLCEAAGCIILSLVMFMIYRNQVKNFKAWKWQQDPKNADRVQKQKGPQGKQNDDIPEDFSDGEGAQS